MFIITKTSRFIAIHYHVRSTEDLHMLTASFANIRDMH